MKTMTLDEVKKLPPLSKAEIEKVKNFKNTDFSDCPIQSKEDLAQFRPCRESRKNLDMLFALENFGQARK